MTKRRGLTYPCSLTPTPLSPRLLQVFPIKQPHASCLFTTNIMTTIKLCLVLSALLLSVADAAPAAWHTPKEYFEASGIYVERESNLLFDSLQTFFNELFGLWWLVLQVVLGSDVKECFLFCIFFCLAKSWNALSASDDHHLLNMDVFCLPKWIHFSLNSCFCNACVFTYPCTKLI